MKKVTHNKETSYILFPANFVIEILGNVASGKTTISRQIARMSSLAYVNWDVYTKNPFLQRYVKNPRRWAFSTELSFSFERSKKVAQILKQMESEPLVLDSGFDMGMYVYAKAGYKDGDMNEEEWKLLTDIHQKLIIHAPRIDAAIFMDVPIEVLMKRMWERGREHEQHYSRKYIEGTQQRIEEYKNDMIALNKRRVVATYHQLEKQLEFHTKEDKKIQHLFELL
jgi:deoxyadenosine/deoxycytidine kinase